MLPTIQINAEENLTQKNILTRFVRSHTIENFIVIWLDLNFNESDINYYNSITQLQHIVNSVETFTDINKCIDFLTDVKDQKVFLIISDEISETLVPLIHDVPQIDSIYILYSNGIKQEQCVKDSRKVKAIVTDISFVLEQLQRNTRQCEQNLTSISIVSASSTIDLNELDQSFMYSQLLKETLLEMKYDDKAKKEFIEFCRVLYADNNFQLCIIDEFERDYHLHSPIWWYTRHSFIYSILNKALRTQDIDIIITMGFYVKDLHQQIEQVHSVTKQIGKMIIYRGQGMSNIDFEKMKTNQGGLFSFNNFLSTSIDREVSLAFADSARYHPDLTGILFRLEIDPSISSSPFASLDNISYFSDTEKEILFSMHTVFRIGEIKQIDEKLWEVTLTLTSDNDEQLKRLAEHMRSEIQETTGLNRLGKLLIRMGELTKAEKVYETQLKMTCDDNLEQLAFVHGQLGYILQEQGDILAALKHYEKTIEIRQKILPFNDSLLIDTYNNIAELYNGMGDYSTALFYLQKILEIQQKCLPSNHPWLASIYNNIAQVLRSMGDYLSALSYYQRSIKIMEEVFPPNHPWLAVTYSNIGLVYDAMGEYKIGLEYVQKSLKIQQKVLPSNHPSLAVIYNNIGELHWSMRDYLNALSYYQKSLEINQKILSPYHPLFATLYNNISLTYHSMGNYSTAFSYAQQALDIQQKSLPSNHPHLAITYHNISQVHRSMGNYSTEILYLQKALEIELKAFPPNHPSLATTYNNIGLAHQSMGDYPTALSYYQKSLEIIEKGLPPNYPVLATTYSNIGVVYYSIRDYSTALSYYQKALDIKQKFLPPHHPSLSITYNNIGEAYRLMGDYSSALSYYEKTLAIEQEYLPPNHPDLAITYNNFGLVYRSIGDNTTALSYYKRTLEIQQKALPPNHPSLASTYHNMAHVFEDLHLYKEAIKYETRAVDISRLMFGVDHPQVIMFQNYLAKLYQTA